MRNKNILDVAKQTLALAQQATPGPWNLEHDDTYISAEKVPPEPHDWYWIVGAIGNDSGGVADDEYRGPKEVIQNNCRFIAASRTNTPLLAEAVLTLSSEVAALRLERDAMIKTLSIIATSPHSNQYAHLVAQNRLTKLEGK